jgi:uncharacterized membrane-anchored protein
MVDAAKFDNWLQHLTRNPDAAVRAKAAYLIGRAVEDLDPQQYQAASQALQKSMTDHDPTVLMAAMSALSTFTRGSEDVQLEEAEPRKGGKLVKATVCAVCGKPEAVIDPDDCEYPNCPYK